MADRNGFFPTKDGRYKGKKIECAVCGLFGRRVEMVYQRGYLVHRDTCKDDSGHKPKGVA